MDSRWTTRCCSALALTLACAAPLAGQGAQPPETPEPAVVIAPQQRGHKRDEPFSPFPAQKRWTLALNNVLVAPPVFDGARGYFPIAGDRIVAYDLSDGTLLWIASAQPQFAPVIGDGLLFVAGTDSLTALRLEDGWIAWQLPLAERPAAPLAWENGWLVAATRSALFGFRGVDGSPMWQRAVGSPPHAAPALADGRIYLPVEDGRVMAFQIDSGEVLWERRLGAAPSSIKVAEERLFVGSRDDYLYCLRASDGIVQWRWRTGADVVSAPVVVGPRVYFVSLDNVLRALNRSHGVQQWKRALPFRPEWGPIQAGDALVVAGFGGPVRAFFLKDGAPASDMSIDSGTELAAQPYGFESPLALGPIIVTITRSLEAGATVTASSRSIEPPMLPAIVPLPGALPVPGPKPQ